jgi:hypothetical protein
MLQAEGESGYTFLYVLIFERALVRSLIPPIIDTGARSIVRYSENKRILTL